MYPKTWINLKNIEWKKSYMKEYILYDSIYMMFKSKQNLC